MNEKCFDVLVCIESGEGFKKGNLYAQVGSNNGLTVLREDENGDIIELMLHNYSDGTLRPADVAREYPIFR